MSRDGMSKDSRKIAKDVACTHVTLRASVKTACARIIQSSYLNPVLSDVKFACKVLADVNSRELLVLE